MKRSIVSTLLLASLSLPIQAVPTFSFYEMAIYVDGSVSSFDSPGSVDCSIFSISCSVGLDADGIGEIVFDIDDPGGHEIGIFADYELTEAGNTFFNEYGEALNEADKLAGLAWEVDEPGFVFGDIYDNFLAGTLDNSTSLGPSSPDDASMALIWAFDVPSGGSATLSFSLSETAPSSGFTLAHRDMISPEALFLSADLTVTDTPDVSVPEPSTLMLLLSGFALAWRRGA